MKLFLTAFVVLGVFVAASYEACSEKFKKEFLAKHNEYRSKHGVASLTIDESITNWAQDWANKLASSKKFDHRPSNKYGENIYMTGGTKSEPSASSVVNTFYNEIKNYPYFGKEPNLDKFFSFGHFTQLIWKQTKKVGVGCAKSGNNYYIVANYDPFGNYPNQYAANVLALKKSG